MIEVTANNGLAEKNRLRCFWWNNIASQSSIRIINWNEITIQSNHWCWRQQYFPLFYLISTRFLSINTRRLNSVHNDRILVCLNVLVTFKTGKGYQWTIAPKLLITLTYSTISWKSDFLLFFLVLMQLYCVTCKDKHTTHYLHTDFSKKSSKNVNNCLFLMYVCMCFNIETHKSYLEKDILMKLNTQVSFHSFV